MKSTTKLGIAGMFMVCLAAGLFLTLPAYAVPSDWWNVSWSYRDCFNITNNDDETLNNATFNNTFDIGGLVAGGKLQADYDDLRVTENGSAVNGSVVNFNYTIHNATALNVYFKLDNITSSGTREICYYYGNTEAPNGTAYWRDVYLEYDNFDDDSLDTTNIWNLTGADIIESEGMLHIRQPDASWSNDFIVTLRAFSTPVLIEFEYNRRTSEYFGTGWANLDALNDFPNNMQNATRFYIDGVNDRHDLYANHNGVLIDQQFGSANTVGTWYNGSLRMNSTYYDMLINGVVDNSVHRPINFTQPIPVYMAGYDMGGANANTSINIWKASRWIAVAPTYSAFSGEETIITPPPVTSWDAFAGLTADNMLMRVGCSWDNSTDYCSTGVMGGYNATTDEILCCLLMEV